MGKPVLYVFSGMPGVGKTTLAVGLAKHLGATYLRVDCIEQSLKDIYQRDIYDEGYQIAFQMASDSLKLGMSVVGDSCNAVKASRVAWQNVASRLGFKCINIQVVCSDLAEHRRRVENRASSIPNLQLSTWQQVQEREYEPWITGNVDIDTAYHTEQQSIFKLVELLGFSPTD